MDPTSPPPPDSAPPAPLPGATVAGVSRAFSVPQAVGMLFLAAQVIFVLVSTFAEGDPRLLTPVEGITRYDIAATMDAHTFEPQLIRARYGIPPSGCVGLTADAVQEVITHRERPIPLERAIFVRLHTQEAGGAEEFWLWPQE
jgi:hypothetical protein